APEADGAAWTVFEFKMTPGSGAERAMFARGRVDQMREVEDAPGGDFNRVLIGNPFAVPGDDKRPGFQSRGCNRRLRADGKHRKEGTQGNSWRETDLLVHDGLA